MKRLFVSLALLSIPVCYINSLNAAPKKDKNCDAIQNIIFMIGDGMGLAQTSMYMIENSYEPTAFDRAENIALIKTYSANNRVTDSAAAGTALACGEKTNNKMIGITPSRDTCYAMTVIAQQKGMSTGIVASCSIQHATPAAFYAHVDNRNDFEQISRQLAASKIDFAVGGGEKYFAQQINGRELTEIATENGFNIVRNFDELDATADGRILGLFEQEHIKSIAQGRGDYLPRATKAALSHLSKNKNGFVLMVEGSQIDWACHSHDAKGSIEETDDFNNTLHVVMDFADNNPGTLVVITADHETGGLAAVSGDADFTKSDSGVEYKFSTGGHSGIMVPVYTYGTGAEKINGVMENTELAHKMIEIISNK